METLFDKIILLLNALARFINKSSVHRTMLEDINAERERLDAWLDRRTRLLRRSSSSKSSARNR